MEEASDQAILQIQALEEEMQSMIEHIDDLANRGRRKNICVIELSEGVADTRPTNCFGTWLPDFLQLETSWADKH